MSGKHHGRLLRLTPKASTIPSCGPTSRTLASVESLVGNPASPLPDRTRSTARTFETLAGDGPTVRRYKGGASVRIRVSPGPTGRPAIRIWGTTDDDLRERARVLDDLARRMHGFVPPEDIEAALVEVGKARTPKGLEVALKAAEFVVNGTTTKITTGLAPTFAEFAEQWTDKTLHKRHPDHVPDKDEWEDKQILRDYINPKLGKRRLPDVTLVHVEEVMQALPERLGPRTRRHIAQCMRKVMSLAVYPGRHIAANPIPREWMPKVPKSANKAKTCLFPDEDAKLLSCAAVPLERRVAYGVLTREGMRASELSDLRWRDVDLARGRVRLDENKTDDPRAWALSPDVVRALAWWKKRTGGDDSARVLGGLDLTQGPRWLRGKVWEPKTGHKNEVGDLKTAGVTRAELFERTKSRMPIRLHDLRATFVTVSLANGRTEQWVSDRTGHRSSQMLALYTRQARQWSELELGALQAMDALLPEMVAEGGQAEGAAQAGEEEARDGEGAQAPAAVVASAEGSGTREGAEATLDATGEALQGEGPVPGGDTEGVEVAPEAEREAEPLDEAGAAPWAIPADEAIVPPDEDGPPGGQVPNGYRFAPTAGLEPATRRLTAACSTN